MIWAMDLDDFANTCGKGVSPLMTTLLRLLPDDNTLTPTTKPTQGTTAKPTQASTAQPTQAPTAQPTQAPTTKSTQAPTTKPTQSPTAQPTQSPGKYYTTERLSIKGRTKFFF